VSSTRLRFDPIAEARRQWEGHGWEGAASGMALVTSVARVQQIFLLRIDRVLRPLGLTFARYEVLMLLRFSRRGALPLGKIGARLQVQPGAVTNAVDRLESEALVVRRAHDTDGRATLAAITPKGRRLAARATAALNRDVFEATGLTAAQETELVDLLRAVRHDAGDFEDASERAPASERP
jgi:DNA-binding MarR family transcriptional regulator